MIPTPLLFRQGDLLSIRDEALRESLWRVLYRKGGGYETKPLTEGERRFWSDAELDEALITHRLKHIRYDLRRLGRNAAQNLAKTWEYWPEHIRREALRRFAYVRRLDASVPLRVSPAGTPEHAKRRERCVAAGERYEVDLEREATLDAAYDAVREAVWAENHDDWEREERDAHLVVLRDHKAKRRIRPATSAPKARLVGKPSKSTVRRWWELWDAADGDIRVLISSEHARGNRQPFYKETAGDGETTYRLMAWAVDEFYNKENRPNARAVWRLRYKPACEERHLPFVSYRTFRLFIRTAHTVYERFLKRYGARAAKLKFRIFKRNKPPEIPLEEVEVDHCLIDLVVKHPITGRKLGRPWLTLLIDRATRAILGCHLSFEVPSYASLQRALAHAFWRKDVSGIEGIKGSWPMHGVPVWVFTDNGRELRSASLRLTEAMLDFGVVNLPAKIPELKGMVERVFGVLGVQVFSLEEGSVLARSDNYDPVERAELTLAEVNHKILKWIVDDYHNEPHPALGRKTPLQAWIEKTALHPVRPVPDFDHIIRMTGEEIRRTISNVGVQYEGYLFVDPADRPGALEALRRKAGADREWVMRVDPYNYGQLWLLDDIGGEWLVLPNADPEVAVGVSRFKHLLMNRRARELAHARGSKIVAVSDLVTAREQIEQEADAAITAGKSTGAAAKAMRCMTNGEMFSPLYGGAFGSLLAAGRPIVAAQPAPDASPPVPGAGATSNARSFVVETGAPDHARPSPTPSPPTGGADPAAAARSAAPTSVPGEKWTLLAAEAAAESEDW